MTTRILLLALLTFLLFGWFGIMIAFAGLAVAIDWMAHNWGIFAFAILFWIYYLLLKRLFMRC